MSDYLTDEEQVDRIKRLWKEWGIPVVAALVVGIGATVGLDFYRSYQSGVDQEAADLYSSYLEAQSLGEPTELQLDAIREEHGSSIYYVFALLQEAKLAIEDEDYEGALTQLKMAQEISEDTPIGDIVTMRLARVEFELEQFEDALVTLTGVRTDGFRWQAYLLKGDIHFLQDELGLAQESYQAAKDALPSGIDSGEVDIRVASVPPVE